MTNSQKYTDIKSSMIDIILELNESLTEQLVEGFINDGSTLSDALELDESTESELLMRLEDEFNISFENESKITEDTSIHDVIRIISEHLPYATSHKKL